MSKNYPEDKKKDKSVKSKSSKDKGAITNYDLIKAVEKLPRKSWNGIPGVTVTQSQTMEALAKCLFHGQDIYDPRNLVFPSLEKIAKLLRVELSTAKRRMKSLREAGWIFKRERGEIKQTSNQYYFSRAIFVVAEAYELEDQRKAIQLADKAKLILEKNKTKNKQAGELNGSLGLAAKEVNAVFEELLQVDVDQDRAKVIDLVALIQEKHKTLEQQRLQVKNATPGVVKKLPIQSQKRYPWGGENETLNTPNKYSDEVSQLNQTTPVQKDQQEEINKISKEFSESTGINVTPKAKKQLEKNMLDNGVTAEQVSKNVKKIAESPALKLTTSSLARAGFQPSTLAFGERKANTEFLRAMQAGELNKATGHKFETEYDAVNYLFPDTLDSRAQNLSREHNDPIDLTQKYLRSLCDIEFVQRSQRYEGQEYREWKASQGFSFSAQPKIDFSDLADTPF